MIALVATTVLALLVAACGGSTSSTTTDSTTPTPTEVTVALDWTPNTNHVGIYVAEALGYYEAAGLTVKLLPYAETAPETLVSKGIADFGFSYANSIAFARASDLDVVQVFANISKQQYQLAYRADDPSIKSPKDLDGKTYAGFGTPGENSEVATVIQADGGTGKVKKIVLNTSAYEAVYNGSADFTISANTWEGVEAEVNGRPMKYFNPEDYGYPANYSSAIISSNAWLTANPDVAKRFQSLGLKTELVQDLTKDAMIQLLAKYKSAAADATFVAVYFAGHGVNWANLTYVVPVDADLDPVPRIGSSIP